VSVDGFTEPSKIAHAFANFNNACSLNNEKHNQELRYKFLARFIQYHPVCDSGAVSVEVVDQCICKMKHGKAPGLDQMDSSRSSCSSETLCASTSSIQPDTCA